MSTNRMARPKCLRLSSKALPTNMNADLAFRDVNLERLFQEQHAAQQCNLEVNFHMARALAWAAVGIRAAATRQYGAAIITLLGAITTVLPAFAHKAPKSWYIRWRPAILIADNVLQVVLGCYTHDTIYPSIETGSWRSVFVLLSGNGVAWLLFSGLWGSMTFRYMFPGQAALTIIILLYNRTMCQRSAALVQAYRSLKGVAVAVLRTVVPRGLADAARELLHLLPLAELAHLHNATSAAAAAGAGAALAGEGAGEETCPGVGFRVDWLAACLGGGGGGSGGAHPPCHCLLDGESLCMLMQPLTVLVFGFFLPTLYIYASELGSRRRFARGASSRGVATRWLPVHELGPGLVDYFLFGVPAVACMYCYVVSMS